MKRYDMNIVQTRSPIKEDFVRRLSPVSVSMSCALPLRVVFGRLLAWFTCDSRIYPTSQPPVRPEAIATIAKHVADTPSSK